MKGRVLQNGGAKKGLSLDFEPCTLTFSQLHYMVPLPPQQADSPNAITGPSGAKELELLKVRSLTTLSMATVQCCVPSCISGSRQPLVGLWC